MTHRVGLLLCDTLLHAYRGLLTGDDRARDLQYQRSTSLKSGLEDIRRQSEAGGRQWQRRASLRIEL